MGSMLVLQGGIWDAVLCLGLFWVSDRGSLVSVVSVGGWVTVLGVFADLVSWAHHLGRYGVQPL